MKNLLEVLDFMKKPGVKLLPFEVSFCSPNNAWVVLMEFHAEEMQKVRITGEKDNAKEI